MNYCLGLIYNRKFDKILLQLKAAPEWQRDRFNGIGGKINIGEGPITAMQREGMEEIGIECQWEWKFTFTLENGCKVYVYTTTLTSTMMRVAERHALIFTQESLYLYPVSSLPSNILRNLTWLVPMCAQKEFLCGSANMLERS